MSSTVRYIGVDIGGTAVKTCLLDEDGAMVARYSLVAGPLLTRPECTTLARQTSAYVRQQGGDPRDIEAVGLAVPGTVLGASVDFMPNVELDLVTLLECVRDEFPSAGLAYLNDANAGLYAEAVHGAAVSAESVLFASVGTGVGGAFMIGGKIVEGAHGACGEIGHIKVVKGGRRCGCGKRGCLEQYASARGIVRNYKEAGANSPAVYQVKGDGTAQHVSSCVPRDDRDSKSVMTAFGHGDFRARYAVGLFAKTLGYALAQASMVADPELVVIGGGVGEGFPVYRELLNAAYRDACISPCAATPIVGAKLGNDAGCLGAALYAIDHAA